MRTTTSSLMIVLIAIVAALVFVAITSTFAAILTEAQAVKGEAGRHISTEGERHQSAQGARASGVCDLCNPV